MRGIEQARPLITSRSTKRSPQTAFMRTREQTLADQPRAHLRHPRSIVPGARPGAIERDCILRVFPRESHRVILPDAAVLLRMPDPAADERRHVQRPIAQQGFRRDLHSGQQIGIAQ